MNTTNVEGCGAVAGQVERPIRPLPGGLRLTVTERCELYDWRDACVAEAVARAVTAERERWEEALRKTWRMVDPLKPAGTPGSYARGQDSGIVAALGTLRRNLGA